MTISPLERYQHDLQRSDFIPDTAQLNVVERTQHLYQALLESTQSHHGRLAALRNRFMSFKKTPVRGLYLWGGVGRGKTYLVDNFYHSLPFKHKMRLHFHHFMQQVHGDLKHLPNQINPLIIVATHLAEQAGVICLDEFFVADIADAMILSGLLKALFELQVTLVATSNTAPDDLYKTGLQRERFLPAIALIKQHMDIINVETGTDYRLRSLERAETYYYPLGPNSAAQLEKQFQTLAPDRGKPHILEINGRKLPTLRLSDGIVWFDFQTLCNIPRAVADYIELARCFNTVLISNIPQMDDSAEDHVLRLINLVDEFYDRNVKLILSAQTAPEYLYQGERQLLPFQRTLSRLREMGSQRYLERGHLP